MDQGDVELLVRSLGKAVEAHSGGGLDAALNELGWRDALAADPAVAVSSLFELQGAANVSSGALDVVVLHGLGFEAGSAVVLPELAQWTWAGSQHGEVRGLGTACLARTQMALLVTPGDDKYVAARVPVSELRVRPVQGIDPTYGLVEVGAVKPRVGTETVEWSAGLALGQLALGHELVGASRRMLELAREHALARVQFGVTISQFQAVRHRLADTLVVVEAAKSMLDAYWLNPTPVAAAMAKAVAGRNARTAARHCQQVLAGIGFTAEHPFHHYVRRVLLLDQLLGSGDRLTRRLGERLIESRQLPDPVPL